MVEYRGCVAPDVSRGATMLEAREGGGTAVYAVMNAGRRACGKRCKCRAPDPQQKRPCACSRRGQCPLYHLRFERGLFRLVPDCCLFPTQACTIRPTEVLLHCLLLSGDFCLRRHRLSAVRNVPPSRRREHFLGAAATKSEEGKDTMTAVETAVDATKDVGPGEKDPQFPLAILYCGVCGLPPELCEYNTAAEFERCKPWLIQHVPEMYPDLKVPAENELEKKLEGTSISGSVSAKEEKPKSGGKKKAKMQPEVLVQRSQRKGRKVVTVVYGLDHFDVKIPDAAKICKKKFSCGASLVKAPDQRDTLEIQGDRIRAVAEFLRDDFRIPADKIYTTDENKAKVLAFGASMDAPESQD